MLTGLQRAALLQLMSLAEVTGLAAFSWEHMWGWRVQAASLECPGLWWGQLEGEEGPLLLSAVSLGGHCAPFHGGSEVTESKSRNYQASYRPGWVWHCVTPSL